MYQVSIKNITKKFGKTEVLKGINLEVGKGELFFLLGPSGCGKTTLLRILAGFEAPDSGSVSFDNTDVTAMAPQKRKTSLVFQSYALWPHLTVRENVSFGLENLKTPSAEAASRIRDALALVRMEQYAERLPNQLSGGQQQRIALARAIVVNPQLLLLDEPLSNLDARLRAEMRIELLRVHRTTGVTAVYVTHDQEEALSLAHRIGFMDQGVLVQVGTPRELYNNPATVSAARFLGNANVIPGTVVHIESTLITVETPLGNITGSVTTSADISRGTAVHCFFRPEHMHSGTAAANNITGAVTAAMYAGVHEHLYLTGNAIDFQALVPALPTPAVPGTTLAFHVPSQNVRILLS